MVTQKYLDELTCEVVDASIEVHNIMGRGFSESEYHQRLKEELSRRKIRFLTDKRMPVLYKNHELEIDFRSDLYIENCLIVKLKSVVEMSNVFEDQLLTYMKFLKSPKGILLNFNCYNISQQGQKTYMNEYFKQLPKN